MLRRLHLQSIEKKLYELSNKKHITEYLDLKNIYYYSVRQKHEVIDIMRMEPQVTFVLLFSEDDYLEEVYY